MLGRPHLAPDPALSSVVERHLRRLLGELPRADTLAGQVRRVLVEELRLGEPKLARIAARLRTSERTLQRRLGQEGTSVAALLDELRRELSLRVAPRGAGSARRVVSLLRQGAGTGAGAAASMSRPTTSAWRSPGSRTSR